jgi:hypothetical protein
MSKTTDENKKTGISLFKGIISKPSKETTTNIATMLLNGEGDAAFVGVALKKMHKIYEDLKKVHPDAYDVIVEETKKYQEGATKTFSVHGARVTLANTGFWDYSTTDDPYLEALLVIEKEMKILIKSRKEEVETKAEIWHNANSNKKDLTDFKISSFNLMYDKLPRLEWEEGIEVVETNPPVKRGKEQLRYSV